MKFKLESFNRNIDETDILKDLKQTYDILKENDLVLTSRSYDVNGKYSSATIQTRFGSWNNALLEAGLKLNEEKNISDIDLFLNMEAVWTILGRQPVARDLVKPDSKYSYQVYSERFGGWRKSLEAFVEYIDEDESLEEYNQQSEAVSEKMIIKKKRTSRNISDRMRFRILERDGFTCQSCGASPIKERGVRLHIDHIVPWSKGGETEENNLQAKCKQCNLGKGNAFNK